MTSVQWILMCVGILATCGAVELFRFLLRQRNMQYWIGSYYFPSERAKSIEQDQPIDLFVAVCDHWEPDYVQSTPSRLDYFQLSNYWELKWLRRLV